MILTDTGPLVALISQDEKDHARCVAFAARLREPMITTWPCFAETMHLLFRWKRYFAQEKLWIMLRKKALILHPSSEAEIARMQILMEQYRDTPMDLADASLVVAAESLNLTRVFTLDSDFHVYRLKSGIALQIAP